MKQFWSLPHKLMMLAVLVVVAGIAAISWSCSGTGTQTAQAQEMPEAARISQVDGSVGVDRTLATDAAQADFVQASRNAPISVGDRIYARENSRARVEFGGRNFARLNPQTDVDVLQYSDRRTQLALRDGSAYFDVGSLPSGSPYEVATPAGAVDINQPGLYQIGVNDDGSAALTVLSGAAQVVGMSGSGVIGQSQSCTFYSDANTQPYVAPVEPAYAGTLVDDYYSYSYPGAYDGRYRNYSTYVNDPSYYNYNRYASYQYVPDSVAGAEELDSNGEWVDVPNQGRCWRPRVDSNWAPYRDGYWSNDSTWGVTWVSNEQWGWAPYHYGRWAYANNGWYWSPQTIRTEPAYAPALVAFLSLAGGNRVGWVPLGPGDPYQPRYYNSNWQPQYYGQGRGNVTNVTVQNFVNYNVPQAVTVVPSQTFTRVITPNVVERFQPQMVGQTRPVLDPFSEPQLRQLALQTNTERPRMQLPPAVAQRVFTRQVITSSAPSSPVMGPEMARSFHVQAVPEKQRAQTLALNRQTAPAQPGRPALTQTGPQPPAVNPAMQQPNPAEQARQRQEMAALSQKAAKGDKGARQQLQQMQAQQAQQQRQQALAQKQQAAAEAQNQRQQQLAQQKEQQQQARQQQQEQRAAALQQQQQQRAAKQQQLQQQRAQQQEQQKQKQQQLQEQQQQKREQQQQAQQQRAAALAQQRSARQQQLQQQRAQQQEQQKQKQQQLQEQQQQRSQEQNQARQKAAAERAQQGAAARQQQQQRVQQQASQRKQAPRQEKESTQAERKPEAQPRSDEHAEPKSEKEPARP